MLGAHAPCMFALTGSIDPTHDVAVLHLLEQAFRRNHDAVDMEPDQLIVRFDRWYLLLTTGQRRLQVDVVVGTKADASAFRDRFTLETYRWAFPAALTLTWSESRQVPVPLR